MILLPSSLGCSKRTTHYWEHHLVPEMSAGDGSELILTLREPGRFVEAHAVILCSGEWPAADSIHPYRLPNDVYAYSEDQV